MCKSVLESNGTTEFARAFPVVLSFHSPFRLSRYVIDLKVLLVNLIKVDLNMSKFAAFPLEHMESFLFNIV